MVKIIAGMDVSGDQEYGNHKFMAIVIGTRDSVCFTMKCLGNKQIHMVEIRDKKQQERIISQLKFDGKENIAFCIQIEKNKIIQNILETKRIKQNVSKAKIYRAYHYLLLRHVRAQIETFLGKHGNALSDVVFECDMDCVNFAKDAGLKHTQRGDAYVLSDIVAWANNRGLEPRGVVVMDITVVLESYLKRIFKKVP